MRLRSQSIAQAWATTRYQVVIIMTLILTELSGAGIAMVADSAISIWKGGKISTKDQQQWTKLLPAPHIGAGVSYWGAIGEITNNRRFDEWLEKK
jgi:hypothetical protein